MPETAPLTEFSNRGFLVIRGLLDEDQVATGRSSVAEISNWPEEPGRHMVYYEDSLLAKGERIVTRIEDFCPYHSELNALVNGRWLELISELFGEPAVLFKDKINFKLPGGDGFKAHQDVQAGWDKYAGLYITVLISVDAATIENGCLEIGTQANRHEIAGKSFEPLSEEQVARVPFEPCPTSPGDAIFFDSLVPHRSGPNLTDGARRILYLTYNRASEGDHRRQYFADKRVSFPPDCERQPGDNYVFRV